MRKLLIFMILLPKLVLANQFDDNIIVVKECYYFKNGYSICLHESSFTDNGFSFNTEDKFNDIILRELKKGAKNGLD